MNTFLFLIFFLSLVAAVIAMLIAFIKRLKHKPFRGMRNVYLSLMALGAASFIASIMLSDPASGLTLAKIICFPLAFSLFVTAFVKTIKRRKPLKFWVITAVTLAVYAGLSGLSSYSVNQREKNQSHYEVKIQIDPDFEVKDGDKPVEILTSDGFDTDYKRRYRHVYDSDALSLVFNKTYASAEECKELVKKSENIDDEYREFFLDFLSRIEKKYPKLNLAVLYNNLSTLKVIVLPKAEYLGKSLDINSYGCYLNPENTIYIPEGTEYIEGDWGFQVLIHEFCHALRISWFKDGESENRITFKHSDDYGLVEEAMNSVFSCSLLNYYERDIAYQIPSNYLRIMLECMDNYTLSDYVEHGDTYFFSKLDEFTGHTNYAQVIWKLITLQRNDRLDNKIDLPAEKYEPIYDYLCDMYFDKYINKNMSDGEMKEVVDGLVEKAFYDAPEDAKIEKDYFYNYLEIYLEKGEK